MTQPGLFEWRPAAVQRAELARVAGRIADAIVRFCAARVGAEFHAGELREAIEAECGTVAPGSADRVLRALRQAGRVDYVVVSRAGSLYRVESVRGQ